MISFDQSSPTCGVKVGHDPLSAQGQLACWRDPSANVLRERLSKPATRALADLVNMVRPAARELAQILDRGEPAGLIGAALAGDRGRTVPPANLADDLLASALLIEGVCGDPTAQLVVDHLRRRRGLIPLVWPKGGRSRRPKTDVRTRKLPSVRQTIDARADRDAP